jgi:hypothetical protein
VAQLQVWCASSRMQHCSDVGAAWLIAGAAQLSAGWAWLSAGVAWLIRWCGVAHIGSL